MRELLKSAVRSYRQGGSSTLIKRTYLKAIRSKHGAYVTRNFLGDIVHEKLKLYPHLGYWPNIERPRSFNEKINYRKFFTNNEKFTEVEDKWKVRDYVKEKVGEEILPEILHVTNDPETIPFEELSGKFVVKANHGSGWNTIVKDKDEENFEQIKEKCEEWLNQKYGKDGQEYWYWDIEPKILIESFIESKNFDVPRDYKFYVFDGEVVFIQVNVDRFSNHSKTLYDREWNKLDIRFNYPKGPEVEKPENLEEMIRVAEKLGEEFDFVRVDLYNPEMDKVLFGELTIAPASGKGRFRPREYDFELGSHWPID